jgi:hypothetical protein
MRKPVDFADAEQAGPLAMRAAITLERDFEVRAVRKDHAPA